jgi:hypothetical protein
LQTPLWQSEPDAHVAPEPQAVQPPPQSVSVSAPFRTRSEQLGTWHFPTVQTRLVQLVASTPQLIPLPHGGHTPPPQSVSVSSPSMTPFEQLCCAQTWLVVQKRFGPQSVPDPHPCPAAHWVGQDPPQSTSVSVPLRTPSVQLGAWQVDPMQEPESQSLPEAQCSPWVQRLGQLPPQSTSLSEPFAAPSEQDGA